MITPEVQIAGMKHALEMAQQLIHSIQTDRKASIGSMGNTYVPQLSVTRVDATALLVNTALNDLEIVDDN